MATNLNPRTRKKWRDRGYHVELTEFMARLPGGIARRQDLFGFCDMLMVPTGLVSGPFAGPNAPWIYVQVTSRSNMASRLKKIREETTGKGTHAIPMANIAGTILARGDKILVEGWDQPKGPGTLWRSKERWLTLGDLD